MLPQEFTRRMQDMLKEEYPQFIKSYEGKNYRSLRLNPLKGSDKQFMEKPLFHLMPVPWAENGYYYGEQDQPGRNPFHEAGVYYIQEASAMLPVQYLEARPGEKVLDLCAAPGGKSTQAAAAMRGRGVIVCNEIHPARASILSGNIERMGIGNALVTNETPQSLARHFPLYFDRILVDAPCSGEGMFRKNAAACEEWSVENVRLCAQRQDEIMEEAASMLRPGGRIVYSTCTFAPEENEGTVSRFLKKHKEFSLLEGKKLAGMSGGMAEWVPEPAAGLDKTVRLWPHKIKGEGHFAAVLVKDEEPGTENGLARFGEEKGVSEKECAEYIQFRCAYIDRELEGVLLRYGEQLYLAPEGTPSLRGIRVLRPGLHLGTLKKNRFEPSHALALFLKPEEVKNSLMLDDKKGEVCAYLNGQTLQKDGEKGWYLLTADGYSIGWGKLAGGIMKNHYPKGLRKN